MMNLQVKASSSNWRSEPRRGTVSWSSQIYVNEQITARANGQSASREEIIKKIPEAHAFNQFNQGGLSNIHAGYLIDIAVIYSRSPKSYHLEASVARMASLPIK